MLDPDTEYGNIRPSKPAHSESSRLSRQIFVGGLPTNVTPPLFREWAEISFPGRVVNAVLVVDTLTHTRSRGFGFVTFDSNEMVDIASRMRLLQFAGKLVEVKKAENVSISQRKKVGNQEPRTAAGQNTRGRQKGAGGGGSGNGAGDAPGVGGRSAAAPRRAEQDLDRLDPQSAGQRARRPKGGAIASAGGLNGLPDGGMFRLPGPKDGERFGEPGPRGSGDPKEFIIPPPLQEQLYSARAWAQGADMRQAQWKEQGGAGAGGGYEGLLRGFAPAAVAAPLSSSSSSGPGEYGLRPLLFHPSGGAKADRSAAAAAAGAASDGPEGEGGSFEGFEGTCDGATGSEHLGGGGEGGGGAGAAGLFALQASIVNMAIDDDDLGGGPGGRGAAASAGQFGRFLSHRPGDE